MATLINRALRTAKRPSMRTLARKSRDDPCRVVGRAEYGHPTAQPTKQGPHAVTPVTDIRLVLPPVILFEFFDDPFRILVSWKAAQ